MSSFTVHLPDPDGPDDERYIDTLHGTWASVSAAYGRSNVRVVDHSGLPLARLQEGWEVAGRQYPWNVQSGPADAESGKTEDPAVPTIQLAPDLAALLYSAARLLDVVAPLHPAPIRVALEKVDSPAPKIIFALQDEADRDDQVRTVDSFAEALGVRVRDDFAGNRVFTAVFQGVKVTVRTALPLQQTWRPQTQWAYEASQHAEELHILAGTLRTLGPRQVRELMVWYSLPNAHFLNSLTVTAEGLRQLEKLNGCPVEPSDNGRYTFTGLLPDRDLLVHRLA
jgi:hypothetical protein